MTESDKTPPVPAKKAPTTARSADAKPAEKPEAKKADKPGARKSPPTSAGKKTPRKSLWRFVKPGRVIWLAIIVLLAWLAWPIWGPFTPGWMQTVLAPVMEAGRTPGLARKVEGLEQRIATLEKSVQSIDAALKTQSGSADIAKSGAALSALSQQAAQFESRLKSLEQNAGASDDVKSLRDRLSATDAILKELAARPVPTAKGQALVVPPALVARIDRLESENQAMRRQLTALSQQVKAASMAARDPGDPVGVLMLAAGQLQSAAAGQGGWLAQWRTVAALTADDPVLAAPVKILEPYADKGVPELGQLRSRFPKIADQVARATQTKADGSWFDRTVDRLSNLVTIRRTGPGAAKTPGDTGALSRAESHLAQRDLKAAIAELDGLSPAGKKAAAGWLRDARARFAVEQALETLQAALLMRAAGKGKPGG